MRFAKFRRAAAHVSLAALLFCVMDCRAQFSSNPSFGSFTGFGRKRVTLKRRLPPIYAASGKIIDVSIDNGQVQTEVLAALQKQLTQADSSIKLGGDAPDLRVTCKVSSFTDIHVVNQKTNEGTSEVMQGQIGVAFNISETSTRRVVKADLATSEVSDEVSKTASATPQTKIFGGLKVPSRGPTTTAVKSRFSSTAQARTWMVEDVARKIANYLVITDDTVEAQLAVGGALNGPDNLATSGLWTRDLEELETLPPYGDPKYDAYRVYDIGVANEALAYQATDVKSAIKYLEQASNDYGKALDAKPDEKGFLDPQNRIKAALAHYAEMGKAASAPPPATTVAVAPSGGTVAPACALGGVTNQEIIDMVQNKIDSGNIVDTIQHSPVVCFDLTPKGQIQLTKGGVTGQLLTAMKQRVRGAAPAAKR